MSGEISSKSLVDAGAVAATVNAGDGPVILIAGMRGRATATLDAGAATAGTLPTLDAALYESDDQSTWTAVPGGAFTRVTTVKSVQEIVFRPGERKQYLTAKLTIGGSSSPSFPVSMVLEYLAP